MRMRDTLAQIARNSRFADGRGLPSGRLTEFAPVSLNPGDLGARMYVPEGLPAGAPLVVVLHGCTQTAEGYDAGTGWSRLAERAGFALLFPEQRRANNANLCFNWFQSADIARVGGEAESIAQMVAAMVERHGIDRERIFVTGLSAGGAMTAVMLATYPDVFAGGAIIGGLPYGCAQGVSQALEQMAGRGRAVPAGAVSRASSQAEQSRWPTVSIWHGAVDATVVAGNLDDLAAQWCGVHGMGKDQPELEAGRNWERRRWSNGERVVVETWRISGMGHGVPIDPAGPEGLGAAGAYMLPVGIDSTAEIARSWGLIPASAGVARPVTAVAKPVVAVHPAGMPAIPATMKPRATARSRPQPVSGIQNVIEDALRSAGLMK